MDYYNLNYTIEKILGDESSSEQTLVKRHLDADLSKREAKYLWGKIVGHKRKLDERLKRDVGFRVAAIDYIENFYEPVFFVNQKTGFGHSLREFLRLIRRAEFLPPKSL